MNAPKMRLVSRRQYKEVRKQVKAMKSRAIRMNKRSVGGRMDQLQFQRLCGIFRRMLATSGERE